MGMIKTHLYNSIRPILASQLLWNLMSMSIESNLWASVASIKHILIFRLLICTVTPVNSEWHTTQSIMLSIDIFIVCFSMYSLFLLYITHDTDINILNYIPHLALSSVYIWYNYKTRYDTVQRNACYIFYFVGRGNVVCEIFWEHIIYS